jgi:1-acyl-sn-glycerol-3-phosphate acyltransferase
LYKAVSAVEDIDSLIEQTIEDFKIQDYHALAWYFPEGMRNDESHTKKIRPGFALMARNLEFNKK